MTNPTSPKCAECGKERCYHLQEGVACDVSDTKLYHGNAYCHGHQTAPTDPEITFCEDKFCRVNTRTENGRCVKCWNPKPAPTDEAMGEAEELLDNPNLADYLTCDYTTGSLPSDREVARLRKTAIGIIASALKKRDEEADRRVKEAVVECVTKAEQAYKKFIKQSKKDGMYRDWMETYVPEVLEAVREVGKKYGV